MTAPSPSTLQPGFVCQRDTLRQASKVLFSPPKGSLAQLQALTSDFRPPSTIIVPPNKPVLDCTTPRNKTARNAISTSIEILISYTVKMHHTPGVVLHCISLSMFRPLSRYRCLRLPLLAPVLGPACRDCRVSYCQRAIPYWSTSGASCWDTDRLALPGGGHRPGLGALNLASPCLNG